jgi:hypothetical protein
MQLSTFSNFHSTYQYLIPYCKTRIAFSTLRLVSFGHPRGVVEGSCHSRRFLFTSRAHRADQRGINGSMKLGSDSIVVSRQDPGLREEDGECNED